MSKIRVAVIFGGKSNEHDVSVVSATHVIKSIPKDKYDVICIGITKKGHWMKYIGDVDDIASNKWEQHPDNVPCVLSPDPLHKGFIALGENGEYQNVKVDVIFPVLHGKNGEDGTIQGLLEMAHIPYVGPGVAASACSMDKSLTKVVVEQEGVRQAAFYLARRHAFAKDAEAECAQAEQKLGSYPVFVKPCSEGSSVGVSKATDRASLKAGLAEAFKYDSKVLVEEFIDGHEIEVAVLGNEEPTATFAGEIAPSQEFYTFEAKYVDGTSGLYIPAHISEKAMQTVREDAVRVYRALGCKGLSRVDFFCTYAEDEIVFNEINTIPGFTNISMYPKLQEHMGLAYADLIDKLIGFAMERYDG